MWNSVFQSTSASASKEFNGTEDPVFPQCSNLSSKWEHSCSRVESQLWILHCFCPPQPENSFINCHVLLLKGITTILAEMTKYYQHFYTISGPAGIIPTVRLIETC